MSRLLWINGPKLGRLGQRKPELYGTRSLEQIVSDVRSLAEPLGIEIVHAQADDEALLVEAVARDSARCDGIVCNPASLTPSGLALRQALDDSGLPVAIVHLTNVAVRRDWSERDIFMDVARIYVAGAGWVGYQLAVLAFDALLQGRIPR